MELNLLKEVPAFNEWAPKHSLSVEMVWNGPNKNNLIHITVPGVVEVVPATARFIVVVAEDDFGGNISIEQYDFLSEVEEFILEAWIDDFIPIDIFVWDRQTQREVEYVPVTTIKWLNDED